MSYKLLIVESPTKVNSIGRYLKSVGNYKIASSMGHLRDLPSKGGMNVDIANGFKPNYQIAPGKQKTVSELKKLSKEASEVIMASDEDREGEAIAWHLCHILNLDSQTTKRITFNEITADALQRALKNPRTIDQNLVNAQQARRILDRIVGFELSPVLWMKIQPGLSAGRVQSIAMRLIYERQQEIKNFQPERKMMAQASFDFGQVVLMADLKNKLNNLPEGRQFLEKLRQATFKISDIVQKPSLRKPSPPLKTSTLQQIASQKLGFGVQKTMIAAQHLYEAGFITYMRTDSLTLSQQAQGAIKAQISQDFGDQYYVAKQYRQKTSHAQEAHEAIRPTDFTQKEVSGVEEAARKLYRLIYRRTLASQMAPARFQKTTLSITDNSEEFVFTVQGQVLEFAGFLEVLQESDKDVILPECQIGQEVKLLEAHVKERLTEPPSCFTEASLVKKMEELGIGRPSTYAPTINTLLTRQYVIKGDLEPEMKSCKGLILQDALIRDYESQESWGGGTNKLLPTALAELVTPFLKEHFPEIMDYDFTSKIEGDFDQIALGQLDWTEHLSQFYQHFHPLIETAQAISRQKITQMREVGLDPKDGKMIYARLGRRGPMLQKGLAEESKEKPLFAPLPDNTTIENVTLKQALSMFEFPKLLGQNNDEEDIWVKNGPFGAYLEMGKLRLPLKDVDPKTVTLEQALSLFEEKKEADRKKIIVEFGDKLKILNGIYGPYVTDGVKNGKIPKEFKDQDLSQTTQEDAQRWLDETGKKPRPKRRSKK